MRWATRGTINQRHGQRPASGRVVRHRVVHRRMANQQRPVIAARHRLVTARSPATAQLWPQYTRSHRRVWPWNPPPGASPGPPVVPGDTGGEGAAGPARRWFPAAGAASSVAFHRPVGASQRATGRAPGKGQGRVKGKTWANCGVNATSRRRSASHAWTWKMCSRMGSCLCLCNGNSGIPTNPPAPGPHLYPSNILTKRSTDC